MFAIPFMELPKNRFLVKMETISDIGIMKPNLDESSTALKTEEDLRCLDEATRVMAVFQGKIPHPVGSYLPNRIIVDNPFVLAAGAIISYGIIVHCSTTRRWLLIRRRHSPEFTNLLRGKWRRSSLPLLIKEVTYHEAEQLLQITDEASFTQLYHRVVRHPWSSFGWQQFLEHREEICHLLRKLVHRSQDRSTRPFLRSEPEWLWPKGRREDNESPRLCALRELREETGIVLTENQLSETFMSERWCGSDGQLYEARCWVAVVNEELPIRLPSEEIDQHPGEIGDVDWLPREVILQKARPWSIRLLYRANAALIPRLQLSIRDDVDDHAVQCVEDDGPPEVSPETPPATPS